MSMLVNQFCEASREWAQKADSSDTEIPFWVMIFTGGGSFRGGHKNKWGHQVFSIEEMKEWLETLTHEMKMYEEFLVVALIQAIEKRLEMESEDLAKGIKEIREFNDFMQTEDADELFKGRKERIQQAADTIAEHITPSLEKLRARRIRVDTWREVTAPILETDNLEKGTQLWLQHLFPQEG